MVRKEPSEKIHPFVAVCSPNYVPNGQKLLRWGRFIYVIIYVFFLVIYWSVIISNKFKMEREGLKSQQDEESHDH